MVYISKSFNGRKTLNCDIRIVYTLESVDTLVIIRGERQCKMMHIKTLMAFFVV